MTIPAPDEPALAPGLEKLDWADIPALVELERILFPGDSPWTAEMFWGELAAGNHYVVHRDSAGEIDGYAGLAVIGIEAEIRTIGVRPVCMSVSSSKPSSMVPKPPGRSTNACDSFMKVSLRVKK